MDNARIAEWILGLAVPPDRAASTVGDWMEDASERGAVWFWSSVLRGGVAHIWSDLAASPDFMATLGLRSSFYATCLTMAATFLFFVLPYPVSMVGVWFVHGYPLLGREREMVDFASGLVLDTCFLACLFQTGRWIARRAPGREMACCIAFYVVQTTFSLIWLAIMYVWDADLERSLSAYHFSAAAQAYSASDVFNCLSLFAGALWVRRKSPGSTVT